MKKIVGILGILGLTFFGFTNAGLQEFDLGVAESITANTNLGYSLRLTANANFLTNDLYKVVKFKGNGNYPSTWTFFRNGTGLYTTVSCEGGYNCNGTILKQGFVQYYNEYTLSTIDMTAENIGMGLNPINNFLSNNDYNNPDKLLLGGYSNMQIGGLCFGYTDLDKAICFVINRATVNDCGSYPQYCNYLTNSLSLNTQDIEQLANIATVSPFTTITPTPTPTEKITYSCPTINELISTYGTNYNTGLCYSSSLIFTGGTIEQITPKTIFELYPTYTDYIKDVNLYNNYCVGPNTTTACQTAFNNRNIEYTLISKTTENNRAKLYGYCNLQLNYEDKNATTCTLSGNINNNIKIEDALNNIIDEERTVITPGTPPEQEGTGTDAGIGSVFDSLGIGNEENGEERRNVVAKAQNAINSMKSIYTKLTGIFRGRSGQNGIIPEYITGLLLLIVLYKIFKK